jgi:hypothetical protein
MLSLLIKTITIAFLHCIGGLLLYRGRVVIKHGILQSDLLVFVLPALFALLAYSIVYWYSAFLEGKLTLKIVAMLGFSLMATCLSFWLSMVVAFNVYGT